MFSQRHRRIIPGRTHFIDRATIDRRFLLIPDRLFRAAFFYWLAFCARKHGILIHRVVLMSNHYHILLTDMRGELPAFLVRFHSRIARLVQRMRSWKGCVLEPQERSTVMEVVSVEAYIKCSHYIETNPISAGITGDSNGWPGLVNRGGEEFPCPEEDLRIDKSLPPTLTLPFAPAAMHGYDSDEMEALVADGIEHAKSEARNEYLRSGRSFLSVKRALKAPHHFTPAEPRPYRTYSPTWVAVTKQAIERIKEELREFMQAYQDAYRLFKHSHEKVEFPIGTWKMVHLYGCPCVPI